MKGRTWLDRRAATTVTTSVALRAAASPCVSAQGAALTPALARATLDACQRCADACKACHEACLECIKQCKAAA